jgi:hypothetical protein
MNASVHQESIPVLPRDWDYHCRFTQVLMKKKNPHHLEFDFNFWNLISHL